jgi:isocitrate dehydrogenase
MTKDLALLVGPSQEWLTTEDFLATLDANLAASLAGAPVDEGVVA